MNGNYICDRKIQFGGACGAPKEHTQEKQDCRGSPPPDYSAYKLCLYMVLAQNPAYIDTLLIQGFKILNDTLQKGSSFTATNFVVFCADPRNNKIGNKLIINSEDSKIFNNFNEIDEKKYHEILIQNTVPLSHFDLVENKSLLLENNFENLNSISWDKGCYVGQELTARMKYRAFLKKRIYSLVVKAGSPKADQTIKVDGINYGKIISIENKSILAMLKIELAEKKIYEKQQMKTSDGLVFDFIT